ncbi:Dual specificity protein phosphatase 9 [Camelus dromedarius]|uniref:Dual specificity protein phosphatase 9 n=1 Tax=Camelus dromedarius TaxID=9838 RepID=A0A5N4C0Z0_CAMDR|nr:Dual specificity protein phosphatase 9 [Camelus dromedarius]
MEGATPPPAGLLPSFPVQILPNLYLGNEALSQNCGVLVHCLAGVSAPSRHRGLPHAEAPPLAQRCLRPGQEKEVQHLAQLQLHGQMLDFERSLRLEERRAREQGSGGQESATSDPPSFFTTPTSEGVFELDAT